jgi:hypothetical protein
MAKEPRFVRRALSERMVKAMREFPESPAKLVRKLTYMESFHPGKAYVFLQLKVADKGDYETEYRPMKQAMLEIACAAAKVASVRSQLASINVITEQRSPGSIDVCSGS